MSITNVTMSCIYGTVDYRRQIFYHVEIAAELDPFAIETSFSASIEFPDMSMTDAPPLSVEEQWQQRRLRTCISEVASLRTKKPSWNDSLPPEKVPCLQLQ
jgi:hypothetical protein